MEGMKRKLKSSEKGEKRRGGDRYVLFICAG